MKSIAMKFDVCKELKLYLEDIKQLTKGIGRNYRLKRNYGITQEDYEKKMKEQNGICAICDGASKSLVVDHNHKTGRVRGLLCTRCNLMLGYLEKFPVLVIVMQDYLEKWGRP